MKKILLISIVILIMMMVGCSKKNTDNNTANIKSEKKSTEYIPEIIEDDSEIVENDPLYSCIKDKEKLLMFASNQFYKNASKKFEVSYYKYDKANKRYEKGEVILKDDTIDTESVVKSSYNEKNNTIAINAYLDKDYLITYDLTNNTFDKICISDYFEGISSKSYQNNIFWNNKDTVIFLKQEEIYANGRSYIVTYNIKSKDINCFKLSDYLDSSKTKGAYVYSLDVNDGLLDVYMVGAGAGPGPEIDNCRIDMEKKEIVSENIFYTRWLWFEDDYIIYCEDENDKCFRVNRQTLGDKEEIPCTEGITCNDIRGFDIMGDYLYIATYYKIFKIDLKNKVRKKIAEIDKTEKYVHLIKLHMITENEGFMLGSMRSHEETIETKFVWIN